jgi:hypothetical protein
MHGIVADRSGSRYGAIREALPTWEHPGGGAGREGTPIRLLCLMLTLVVGCATAATGLGPDADPPAGLPLGRSNQMRSGHFTYRLGSIEQSGSQLRIGLRFSNGTHRSYGTVMLRVVAFGEGGEIRAVRLPVGGILAEQTKPLVARMDDVTFRVQDVTLELIYAAP